MMTTWSQCVLLVVEGLSGRPTLNSVESTRSQEELSSSLLRQLTVLLWLLWMIHFSFSWLCSVASLFCCFVVLLLRCSVVTILRVRHRGGKDHQINNGRNPNTLMSTK